MAITVDHKLDNFTLTDQNEKRVSLEDLKGKKVLLSFHPLAWTSVCTKQMNDLDANYERFEQKNTVPFGISVDPVPSKKAWAKDMGLKKLQILSDFWPHGELAKSLEIFIEKYGFSGRVNILLNEKGEVSWVKVYEIPELPDIQEVLAVL